MNSRTKPNVTLLKMFEGQKQVRIICILRSTSHCDWATAQQRYCHRLKALPRLISFDPIHTWATQHSTSRKVEAVKRGLARKSKDEKSLRESEVYRPHCRSLLFLHRVSDVFLKVLLGKVMWKARCWVCTISCSATARTPTTSTSTATNRFSIWDRPIIRAYGVRVWKKASFPNIRTGGYDTPNPNTELVSGWFREDHWKIPFHALIMAHR